MLRLHYTWNAVSNVDGYNLYVSRDSGVFTKENGSLITDTEYNLTSPGDQVFEAYVKAVRDGIESKESNHVTIDANVAPNPPTNVSLLETGDGFVRVGADSSPSGDVVGYNAYQDDGSGAVKDNSSLLTEAEIADYQFDNVTNNTTYDFWFTAEDDVGNESAASTKVEGTPSGVTQVTLNPTEDTWVRGANPDNTHGDDTNLAFYTNDSNGAFRSDVYLRFDVSSYAGGSVSSALLRITFDARNNSNNTDFRASEVSDDSWSEDTLTWNNKPSIGNQIGSDISFPNPTQGEVLEFDITTFVNSELASSETLISVCLEGVTLINNAHRFASKEHASLDAPELILNP